MDNLNTLCKKCDAQLKDLMKWFKENEDAFDMLDLKLHDASYYANSELEKDFPVIYAYSQSHDYDPYYEFADQSYEQFLDWCSENGINFEKLRHQVGRTSKFYLHDEGNLVCLNRRDYSIDFLDTFDCLMTELGYTDLTPEFTKEGLIDREYAKEYAEDLEANLDYIASGEFTKEVKEKFEDTIKVYNYIKDFKDNQVEYFKDWLSEEQELLEDSVDTSGTAESVDFRKIQSVCKSLIEGNSLSKAITEEFDNAVMN